MFALEQTRYSSRTRILIICLTLPKSCGARMLDSSPDQPRFDWLSRSEFRLTDVRSSNKGPYAKSGRGRFVLLRRNTSGFRERLRSIDVHQRHASAENCRSKRRIGVWVSRLRL